MISLANKYRSQSFDDLIGQDHISSILKYQAQEHIRQANYLFFGPRGTGKTSSARLLAKALNCLNIKKTQGNPCNECENCVAINAGSTLDIMEIDAASHTGVDNIREEVIDKVGYRPQVLKKKIIIIDEVHMLSKGAFNALLKTMEEPMEWMVFILATTEFNRVPDTIISRCQVFNFQKIPSPQIVEHLQDIAKKEEISSTDSGLMMIADLSDGCMRDAIKYLDQISVMGDINESSVAEFLGVVSESTLEEFVGLFESYIQTSETDTFTKLVDFLEEIHSRGVDLTNFPKQLIHYADRRFVDNPSLFSDLSDFSSRLLRQARWFPHPLLLYKTLLYQFGSTGDTITTTKTSSDNTTNQDQNPTNKQPSSNTGNSTKNSGNNTPKKKSPSDSHAGATTTKESSSKNDNTAQVKTSKQETLTSTHADNKTKKTQESGLDTIWGKALQKLGGSLQKLLDQQSELNAINKTSAKIVITNPIAKLSIKQKKNEEKLLHSLSQALGSTIDHIDIHYMTKEEYFQYQMGN